MNDSPTSSASQSASTRQHLLDAARHCVRETGLAGATSREITATAGVNLAAITYHFGSKEELFQAVLTRRLDPMNRDRMQLLSNFELAAAGKALTCEKILAAMFIPAMKLARLLRCTSSTSTSPTVAGAGLAGLARNTSTVAARGKAFAAVTL